MNTKEIEQKPYLIDYATELNEQQFNAVRTDGPLLVIAGAGSGKTRTIIYKVAYLIENGVQPSSILLLTFTKKAANEMKNRAGSILDDRCSHIVSGTFHSFAAMILRRYAERLGYSSNFSIADAQDGEDIINIIRTQMNVKSIDDRFPRKDTIYKVISKAFNTNQTIEQVILDEYPHFDSHISTIEEIAAKYAEYKKQRNIMDYDDLLLNLRDLLCIDDVRMKIAGQFRYVMVDEYQDTNRIQAEIACYLASEHGNIMAVGDDSQSIYSFRGASFKNIMQFPEIYPDCRIVKLEENYRSIQPILNFTNAIIENAAEKYTKKLYSHISGEQRPLFVKTKGKEEQADFVVSEILKLHDKGISLNDIAVLFRSGSHSNELEVKLAAAGLPYIKYGGLRFAETAHIKDIMAFLKLITNSSDEMALYRILSNVDGIGNKTAEKIIANVLQYGIDGLINHTMSGKQFYEELKSIHHIYEKIDIHQTRVSEMIQIVLDYYNIVLRRKYDNFHKRKADIDTLVTMSESYSDIEQFITDMMLDPPNSTQVGTYLHDKEEECLILSTIHSAKGLEWNTVFVIHLIDGLFPSSKSIESFEQIEEERRLFYVASTRAKQRLYLCIPNFDAAPTFGGYGNMGMAGFDFSKPSRFITEIAGIQNLTEKLTYTAPQKHNLIESDAKTTAQSRFAQISKFFNK